VVARGSQDVGEAPDVDGAVSGAADNEAAVGTDASLGDLRAVADTHVGHLALVVLPQLEKAVLSAGDVVVSVGGDVHGVDGTSLGSLKLPQNGPVAHLPVPDLVVRA